MLVASIFIILWSSGYLFVENGLLYGDPLAFLSLRLWGAWVIVALILFFTRSQFPSSVRFIFIASLTGLFSQGLYSIFFFTALHEGISSGVLAIILGIQPLLTVFILREDIKGIQKFGIFLGFIGLFLTVANSMLTGANTTASIICALLSLFGITIGTILQKKYCSSISLTANLFIQYLTSAILASLTGMMLGKLNVIWSASFVISLLWITVIISIGATYLFYTLLKQGKAANVTSYLYCVPPVTALMDYVIFNRVLSLTTIIGMMFVMMGLIMIHYKSVNFRFITHLANKNN